MRKKADYQEYKAKMRWMISANSKKYDYLSAFERWGYVDWRQKVKFKIGDIVYIYCTRPYMKVMYKTIVAKESMSFVEIENDEEFWIEREEYLKGQSGTYARLRLIEKADSDYLSLSSLKANGLKTAPQGPIRVNDSLAEYIDLHLHEYSGEDVFPESDIQTDCFEGATCQVAVNRYERSSIARQKCIEHHGTACFVCGFDFQKQYGEIGKGFIHVHHIVPLNEIGKEYKVDYKKDLIPVCPNCHAMLHRKSDGKYYSWEELKRILTK